MQKPNEYDASTAFTGEFETIKLGGHVCVIKKAEEVLSAKGLKMLAIMFDIAEGENKGFYERQWKSSENKENRKWRGTYNQLIEGSSLPYFKGLITSIEESNPDYKWDWDETTLKGKLFGGVFGRRQYKKANGEPAMATECMAIRSVKSVRAGVEVPEDKMLPTGTGAYGAPPALSSVPTAKWEDLNSDDDLPF